ncbi:hypothetical protein P5673_002962 [Acropora cervicornis]|uniref:Mutator-like transposase domain-containing protein n=1 Tax=Acropora cervicornis TaxID=6130 RepID=A0AAD9R1Y4_ACRCE|nr:hypothetical protein P5673_002962 [Acropora cervicornis]
MAEMGLKKQNHLLPGAVPTIHSQPEANSSEGKKRPIADSEEAEISDRTGKKQRRSRALQKLEVNRLLKDYEEASCSAVGSEPIGDLDLSDLMPETGPGNEERKFNNVGIQCDVGFVWSELRRKCVTSVGTQVEPVITDSEVQCEITLIPTCSTPLCSPVKSVGCHSDDDNKDQDYIPSNLFSAEVMEEEEEEEKKSQKTEENERIIYSKKGSVPPQSESKFIVFLSCLLQLFEFCPLCTEPATAEVSSVCGTLIHVTQKCLTCSYARVWRSQPYIKRIPAGNLLLSAAILYSGSMISQTLRMLKIMKIQCFSRQTYHKHQRNYLIPIIVQMWKEEQAKLVERLSNLEGGIVLSGDGRSDSPGHSAKYGAFTVIEKRTNKVLDVQLVQSNEVPNSSWCEHEGLIRMEAFLANKNLDLDVIITDRNRQNAAYIRRNMAPKGTKHYYDIWHIAKGIGKKIDALAKQKVCENAGLWRRSIINHLYWIAATAPEGDGDMLEAMWKSVSNHIQDVHDGHCELYPECAHGPLDEDERDKEWLQPCKIYISIQFTMKIPSC